MIPPFILQSKYILLFFWVWLTRFNSNDISFDTHGNKLILFINSVNPSHDKFLLVDVVQSIFIAFEYARFHWQRFSSTWGLTDVVLGVRTWIALKLLPFLLHWAKHIFRHICCDIFQQAVQELKMPSLTFFHLFFLLWIDHDLNRGNMMTIYLGCIIHHHALLLLLHRSLLHYFLLTSLLFHQLDSAWVLYDFFIYNKLHLKHLQIFFLPLPTRLPETTTLILIIRIIQWGAYGFPCGLTLLSHRQESRHSCS